MGVDGITPFTAHTQHRHGGHKRQPIEYVVPDVLRGGEGERAVYGMHGLHGRLMVVSGGAVAVVVVVVRVVVVMIRVAVK